MNESQIFVDALKLADPAKRAAFLDTACAGNPEQRAGVEALLRAQAKDPDFLEQLAGSFTGTLDSAHDEGRQFLRESPSPTIAQPALERPGTVIGPYKLLEQIGEGGMGTVYMAEQSHPVQRKVALKVIKAGMDSGQVIARFEAERQALALMDHPNIATVLDAGTTAAGRPYFVMELVKGVPITQYCDENHLPPKARLELFTQVCQAVQHAHQKGVIHRDLKPTNVLVTQYDDKPVPKVIDFGVAKATGGRLTERTMFTGYGQIVGTLEYMSPEQARLNALDIDTRGDIYSLGVLLYELLTGTTPFDKQRLHEAAFDEMLRMIREDEPPMPSTRLSTTEARASIAANRGMEPNKLSGLVRGELDWIVMKALEKDRNRRYETANGFALDIQRYLADEHVLACPPSAGYRFRKFARRNRVAFFTAALVLGALVVGTFISTWQAIRATSAERLADQRLEEVTAALQAEEQQRQTAEAQRQAAEQAQKQATDNLLMARNAVHQMLTEVSQNELANVPQMEPLRRALLEKALQFYQKFLQGNPDDPAIRGATGQAYQRIGKLFDQLGQYADAERTHQESIRILEALVAEFPQEPEYESALAHTYGSLAGVRIHLRHLQKAEPAARESFTRARKLTVGFPAEASYRDLLTGSLSQLAVVLEQLGRYPEAEEAHREALSRREKFAAEDPSNSARRRGLAVAYMSLAGVLAKTGRPQDAEETRRRAVQIHERLVSEFPNNPEYLHGLAFGRLHLGLALQARKQFEEAVKEFQDAIALNAKAVDNYPKTSQYRAGLAESQSCLARLLRDTERPQEAEALYRQALENRMELVAEAPSGPSYATNLAKSYFDLGALLAATGRSQEAKDLYRKGIELAPKSAVPHNKLARMLATSPDPSVRDAGLAVELAKKAVELDPKRGFIWNTLGAAQYSAGDWQAAIHALEKSRELSQGGDSFDYFFLAMAHWQLGEKSKAREWYDRAVEWMEKNATDNEELQRLRKEALELVETEKKTD